MKTGITALCTIAGATCLAALAHAHHSRGNFDLDDVIELNGVVTEYTWRNPHTFVTLNVENDAGEVEEWLLELNSIAVLTGTGWSRDTIQVGDRVTVFGNPDNDRSKRFFFSNYFVLPDGSRMVSAPNYSRGVPIQRPPARELDTTALSTDFTGIWRREGGMGGGMGMGGGGTVGVPGGLRADSARAVSLGNQTPAMGLPVTRERPGGAGQLERARQPLVSLRDENAARRHQRHAGNFPARPKIKSTFRYEILDMERTVHLGTDRPSFRMSSPPTWGIPLVGSRMKALVVDTALFTPADWGIGAGVPSSDAQARGRALHAARRRPAHAGGIYLRGPGVS